MYPVKQLNQFLRNSGFDVTEIDEGLKYQIWGFNTQLTQCVDSASGFLKNYTNEELFVILDGQLPFAKWMWAEKTGWQWVIRSMPRDVEKLSLFPFSSDTDSNKLMAEWFNFLGTDNKQVISPYGKSKDGRYPWLLEFLQEKS
jgi:hypothetical protein